MKKKNFPMALAVGAVTFAMTIASCTSTVEDESLAKDEQVEKIVSRIYQLADDYGVNCHVDRDYISAHLSEVNMDSVEASMAAAKAMEGTYPLRLDSNNKGATMTMDRPRHALCLSSSVEYGGHQYETQKMGTLYGYCRIEWEIIDGEMATPTAYAAISNHDNDHEPGYVPLQTIQNGLHDIVFGGKVYYDTGYGWQYVYVVSGKYNKCGEGSVTFSYSANMRS